MLKFAVVCVFFLLLVVKLFRIWIARVFGLCVRAFCCWFVDRLIDILVDELKSSLIDCSLL